VTVCHADAVAARAVRPTGGDRIRGAFRGWWATILVGLILVPVVLIQPWTTYLDQGPIRADGLGYFAWTRAALDGEIDFCRYPSVEKAAVVIVHRPTATNPDNVRCSDRYPPGLAILQFPVMAALSHRTDPTVVVTPAQHDASVTLGALALVLTCLLVTATLRRLGARSGWVQLAIFGFVFGAGMFAFATYAASYVHIHVAMFVALLAWAGTALLQQGRNARTVVSGLVAGFFIVAMRNADVVIVITLAVAYTLAALRTRDGPWRRRLGTVVVDLLPLAIGVIAAAALQLGLNHHVTGEWRLSSYGKGESFDFSVSHHRQVLWSYQRGLFVYAPLVLVTLVGGLLVRRARAWATLYLVLIAALTAIYGFWFAWDLGGGAGFGHRGFVDIAPIGAIVAGLVVEALRPRARVAAAVVVVLCAAWSMLFTVQMMRDVYPEFRPTPHDYWSYSIGDHSLWSDASP
jgi:hypothetical protein